MSVWSSRLRTTSLVLLPLTFVLTLAFVISASQSLHTSYGMTKITMVDYPDSKLTLGLQTATSCNGDVCSSGSLSDSGVKEKFEEYGWTCPPSAGNWVIAAQSIILALLIWPFIVVLRTTLTVRWKKVSSLTLLTLACILSVAAVAVWFNQCVSTFDKERCVTSKCDPPVPFNTKGEVSGAYGFECVIVALTFVTTVCVFAYQMVAGKTNKDATLTQPQATPSDGYYNAY